MTNNKDLNIVRQWDSADKEEFKRPDHPDFLSAQELKALRFSGVRNNSLTNEREVWILGEIKMAMDFLVIMNNPEAWDQQYAELFGLHHVETVTQTNEPPKFQ